MPRLIFSTAGPLQMRPAGIDPTDTSEWSFPMPDSIEVPDLTRFIPVLDWEVAIIFECQETNPSYSKGARFLNPTQAQIGYFAEIYNGFVTDHGRIQYEKQIHRARVQPVSLPTSGPNRHLVYGDLVEGGFDQMHNSARAALCYTDVGEDPNPEQTGVAANAFELQFRHERGRRRVGPVEPLVSSFTTLTLEQGTHYPDTISGVVWPGWRGTIALEISTYSDLSVPGYPAPEDFRPNPAAYPPPVRPCDGATPPPPPPPPPGPGGEELHF